jgi:hypothetical protein
MNDGPEGEGWMPADGRCALLEWLLGLRASYVQYAMTLEPRMHWVRYLDADAEPLTITMAATR